MHAHHIAFAEGNNLQVCTFAAGLAHRPLQDDGGSRWRIFLLGVVAFEDLPTVIVLQRCGGGPCRLQKNAHADREVCRTDQCDALSFNQFSDSIDFAVPARRSNHHILACLSTGFDVIDYASRGGEINHHVDFALFFWGKGFGVPILRCARDLSIVSPLARYLRHQRTGLAAAKDKDVHLNLHYTARQNQANTSGSNSAKNVPCRRWMTSFTSSSSITNVRLISDAPCEIIRIFLSTSLPNTSAATPGLSRKLSPTKQIIALRPSYFTSASLARSAARAGMALLESTVSETLTSDVETTSTATLCRSKASNIARKNPCASSIRGAATSTIVMRFFTAIALKIFFPCGARAVIFVPSHDGLREFSTYTGIFFCIAGSTVAGCSTLAPK